MAVEVKIGVQNVAREVVIEVDESTEAIEKLVNDAIASDGILGLTDAKGRRVVVPVGKLAYVEIGRSVSGQVGFRS